MSKELTVSSIPVITDEQWSLVKRTLMDSDKVQFSDDEFKLFVNQAKRTGLDPFTRQIYATKTGGKMTVQATIDGLRLIAQRSGEYQGQTRPIWFDDEGKEYRVWPKKKGHPYACEVGVYKEGFKEPLYGMAIFDEYVAKSKDFKTQEMKIGFMWQKMPALMIAKVAEALALRKAFPNDLSGLYSSEEISTSDNEVREVEPQKPQKLNPVIQLEEISHCGVQKENSHIIHTKPESNPQDPQSYPQKKEPERFPKKEEMKITKEQAEFLKSTGHKFGYKTNEISKVILDITGKESWGWVNNVEFEIIIQHIIDNRKGL